MKQWIANLFRRRRKPAIKELSLPCLYSVADGNVRVDVLEVKLPCGHCGYIIRGEFFVEEYGEWLKIIDLRDYNAQAAIGLLQKAATFIAQLERGLVSTR